MSENVQPQPCKQKMFTIKDLKTLKCSAPFTSELVPEAIRHFASLVLDPSTMFGRFPSDYQLILIGSYDPLTACISDNCYEVVFTGDEVKTFYEKGV